MNSVLFTVLSLFGAVTGDCGCGNGGPCLCGPDCQCAQHVATQETAYQIAQKRKEAIKKADAASSWAGWHLEADGWWYPPGCSMGDCGAGQQPVAPRPIFRRGGGRGGRGGC